MKLLRDLLTDHKTGHYVGKDVLKLTAFVVGVGIVVFAAWADHRAGRPVGIEGAVLLLTYALGVGIQKTLESQENRKTTDANGNPLVQAGTAEAPATPEPMPQGPTPPTE